MQRILMAMVCVVTLAACGDKQTEETTNTTNSGSKSDKVSRSDAAVKPSKLREFMAEGNVCGMLAIQEIQILFNTEQPIESRPSSFRDNYSCTYSWEPVDKEERQKRFMQTMMAAAKGEAKKLSLRERALEHQITVSLKASQSGPDRFVPRKLSDTEIEAQIKSAKERAAKRLTEEQKEVAGDAANKMVESMLRKANQNTTIDGVGDAAYWSNFGPGSLEVLDGDIHITVSPMVAATKEADIENAKLVVAELLN